MTWDDDGPSEMVNAVFEEAAENINSDIDSNVESDPGEASGPEEQARPNDGDQNQSEMRAPGTAVRGLAHISSPDIVMREFPQFRNEQDWKITHQVGAESTKVGKLTIVHGSCMKATCGVHPRCYFFINNPNIKEAEADLLKWLVDGTVLDVKAHKELRSEVMEFTEGRSRAAVGRETPL